MPRDERFEFKEPTEIPPSKALVGRGKKIMNAKLKAYLERFHERWIYVHELEAEFETIEDNVLDVAEELGYHPHHSVHKDTHQKIVRFTEKD